MTFKTFTSKINWRQIILHFIAACFIAYSFQTFVLLYDTRLVEAVRNNYYGDTYEHFFNKYNYSAGDLVTNSMWISMSVPIGLLIAFIISLIISIRQRWLWLNSLIVFIATILLGRFTSLAWPYIKMIFWKPGELFHNTVAELSFNGSILLLIALVIFFSRRINIFITDYYPIKTL